MKSKTPIWFIPEEFPDCYTILMAPLLKSFVDEFPKVGAGNYLKQVFASFSDFYIKFGFVREEFDKSSDFIAKKMFNNIVWADKLNQKILDNSKGAHQLAKRINRQNLVKKTNKELTLFYQSLYKYHFKLHGLGVVTTWLADAYDERYSTLVRSVLDAKIRERKLDYNLSQIFSTLTTPTKLTFAEQEESALIDLAEKISLNKEIRNIIENTNDLSLIDEKVKKINRVIWRDIDNFYHSYCWIVYVYVGPPNTKENYYAILQSLFKQKIDFKIMRGQISQKKKDLVNQQAVILGKLKLNDKETKAILLAREMVWLKPYRKEILSLVAYTYENLFREFGKRYGLSVNQIRMCRPKEINLKFLGNYSTADTLNQRIKHCFWFYGKNKEIFTSGRQANKDFSDLKIKKEKIKNINQAFGSCAYDGRVIGKIKIVMTPSDMVKMGQGDILVSRSTNPNIIAAMKKAAAIVTDTGGLTCHAAIVSRELRTPCIVGTKIATKIFRDEDMVEVDATNGVIRKI